MNNHNRKTEIITQKLKKAGLKITPQRITILDTIKDSQNHPTADLIYKKIKLKLPNISFDTVNRTLIAFAKSGVIKIAEGRGGAKRYDPIIEPHHHFHCIKCNRIIDFVNKKYDRIKLPENITKKHKVLGQKIVLDGICQNCKNKKNNKDRNNN
ncbi:MAG TPA: Fur family transcriptional regulator [bacterium]|nr:Fur family transcriptional regulator [bacterium]